MKKIAIVEDEQSEVCILTEFLTRYGEENGESFEITHFKSAIELLTNYRSIYDIIFMDIQMPNMNGMDASLELRKLDPVVTLIFVTNMTQFAAKGYEVQAFRFILKPVSYPEFALCLKRALIKIESEVDVELPIATPGGLKRIVASKLMYVEILGHHVTFHTESGEIETSGTLKKIETALADADFFRCNSCYLVNLKYVTEVDGYEAVVGGRRIGISHPRRREFLQALNDYLGR